MGVLPISNGCTMGSVSNTRVLNERLGSETHAGHKGAARRGAGQNLGRGI